MTQIQCPICKNGFEINLEISVKTKGLTVFRGRMGFLGKLDDVNALLDFIQDAFRRSQRLAKRVLVERLVRVCGIPVSDAKHLIDQLQQEGLLYEQTKGELVYIG